MWVGRPRVVVAQVDAKHLEIVKALELTLQLRESLLSGCANQRLNTTKIIMENVINFESLTIDLH
jgi:hypothetical protein